MAVPLGRVNGTHQPMTAGRHCHGYFRFRATNCFGWATNKGECWPTTERLLWND
jgi:hypothetical protein